MVDDYASQKVNQEVQIIALHDEREIYTCCVAQK